MKKKLLTIFAVLALVVAMVFSVVACGKKGDDGKRPGPVDTPKDDEVDLSELASEGLGVLSTGLGNVLDNALGKTKDKSYDLTLFVKVKVGDSVDADVKLHVAGTFGTKNKGLVDVIVGGQSYVTVYSENNLVYIGEALTQEAMNWYKVDAAEADGLVDKFFPQLVDFLPITVKQEDKKSHEMVDKPIQDVIKGFLPLVSLAGNLILATKVEDGIVKNELSDGRVEYVNTLALGNLGATLEKLKGTIDIRGLLSQPAVEPYKGLINTVCNVIFGGSLDDLLDGKIAPEDAPNIVLSFAAKDKNLTDLGISYENDIAFDDAEDAKKTNVSVAFGLENVKITANSSTAIATDAVTAGIKVAKEPAIKMTIEAEVPGKDVGATVNAYVVPKIAVSAHKHYSVPTQEYYTKEFYWAGATADALTRKEMEAKDHKCENNKICIHVDGWRRPVEADHKCAEGKVCKHDFDYETGKVDANHQCAEGKECKHYDEIDTTDFSGAKAYAVAVKANGDEMQLACDLDVTKLGSDGIIVLKIDLTDMWELMGVPEGERADLPTTYQKTINFWETEEVEEPGDEIEIDPDEYENTMPKYEAPSEDDGKKEEAKLPDNLIDKTIAVFSQGFNIGKVMDLLDDVIDFVKGIYNDVLEPNMEGDKDTKTATLDVAAILKGLVDNKTIQGSEKLKINGEKNITAYLADLTGVANLVDNIMRASTKVPEGAAKPVAGSKYDVEKLKKLVKDYAGIDITDKAFEDTTLVLTGIRGDAKADNGLGFTAELKSEGKTVLKLTMKVDIVDAATVPALKAIGNDFKGDELEKVPDIDDATGEQKVDKDGKPLYKDGEALDNINALMKEILKAYEAKEKKAA